MTNQLFEMALGIKFPWFVQGVDFDAGQRQLTVRVDFAPGTRFAHPQVPGEHPVHDTQVKRLRHLNFFQHECYLEVRVPRVRLPDGRVALVEPDWVGKLSGFTLLFEARSESTSGTGRFPRRAPRPGCGEGQGRADHGVPRARRQSRGGLRFAAWESVRSASSSGENGMWPICSTSCLK